MLVLSLNHSTRLSTSQLEPRRRRETAETMSGLLSVQNGRIHRHVFGSLRDCWTATSKKKECALYTWGYNPDHSEQKMLKSTIKKCHRTTYPHILFSAKAAAKNPSICVPLLPRRAPRARSHLVCAEANVEFNYRAAGIFIDLLYQRENRWTFTVAEI